MNPKTRLLIKKLQLFLNKNNFCPIQFWPDKSVTLTEMHRHCRWRYFSSHPKWLSIPAQIILCIIWPLRLFRQNIHASVTYGKTAALESHRHALILFLECFWLGIVQAIPPMSYYRYRIYLRAFRPAQWMLDHEVQPLFTQLNSPLTTPALSPVSNKREFHTFCLMHTLPCPRDIRLDIASDTSIEPNIVVKPTMGSGGRAIQFMSLANGQWKIECDRVADQHIAQESIAHYIAKTYSEPIVLQERVFNHPEITFVNSKQLVTLRIVTAVQLNGDITPVISLVFVPKPGYLTSNNGFFAAVNQHTGSIGSLYVRRPLAKPLTHYPSTGHQVAGSVLPNYCAAQTIALKAHAKLKNHTFLAWDIAIDRLEPKLLEANEYFDVSSLQLVSNLPLGETRFGQLCVEHIRTEKCYQPLPQA